MGCFLQCFGLTTKRKRRKTLYKVLAREDQKYGNYEVLAITEKAIIPYSESRDQEKEKSGVKPKKKKVSFNLNLQIYEANPSSYQVLEDEEEENKDTAAESEGRVLGDGSEAVIIRYPSNHRYYNCSYDQDEEDEIVYEESDIDDEFDEEYDWDDDDDDGGYESCENYGDDEVCDENSKQKMLSSNDNELKSNSSGRERSMNMNSVLHPVENLSQWKAIKAKVISSKNRRKENVPSEENTSMLPLVSPCILESNDLQSKPLLKEIAVDASLSNWLVSPNYNVSSTIRCQ
ncbi:uncharacterized protein LOC127092085 isoform X2 [Lathyrus oleraceus]|uniref:uncharacterized protein LOC127092085 isoform X2 n=1 Tax=Pisum sativum TaxID=3888 RepID=UPI0021CE71F1|nr:uncharacterized protein LOC127092085 isoform X2 [Pisum sativum]